MAVGDSLDMTGDVNELKELLANDPRAAELIRNKHAGKTYVATG